MWLNPGLTGVISDGDYRVSAIYRNQWSIITQPYSTAGISADVATDKNMNIGIDLLNQSAGDGGYNYTTGYVSFAYSGVRFGTNGNQYLTMGLQAGMIRKSFDYSKLHFGDQWISGIGYNPNTPTSDLLDASLSKTVFDAGCGITYFDATPDKKVNFFGGFAVSHLTQPSDQFVGSDNSTIPMRYTIHGGAKIVVSGMTNFYPELLYMQQGTAQETAIGGYADISATETVSLLLGANYRVNDAVSFFTGINHNNFLFGVSYDANVSQLSSSGKNANSFELSLSYVGKRPQKVIRNQYKCPRL